MAKKKSERKSKTFTEALGLDNIINDKTGFVVGLILLCVAIFICIAFLWSYLTLFRYSRIPYSRLHSTLWRSNDGCLQEDKFVEMVSWNGSYDGMGVCYVCQVPNSFDGRSGL